MTTALVPSTIIRLSPRATPMHQREQFAALKIHCHRLMMIHAGSAEYSIHADWASVERSLKNGYPLQRPHQMSHISLEAICYAVIDEQADLVIWVGRPLLPVLRFFFTDPAVFISWRADIPVVVVSK
jgi:hypothetical protein